MTAEQIQAHLAVLGYDLGGAGVDGIVGPKTRAAIQAFRMAEGVTVQDTEAGLADAVGVDVHGALSVIGTPYAWGGGDPGDFSRDDWLGVSTIRPGIDCSGLAIAVGVVLGKIHPAERDRNAHALTYLCDTVRTSDLRQFDLVWRDRNKDGRYEHVEVYMGRGWCLSASGGGPHVAGDDPNARVKLVKLGQPALCGRWKVARPS